jgi:hypothetical protein
MVRSQSVDNYHKAGSPEFGVCSTLEEAIEWLTP